MKRKIFSILFALVLVLSFSLVTAAPVAAAEIPVDSEMTTPNINTAIANADPGDVVQFEAGTYSLTEPLVVAVERVTLQGANAGVPGTGDRGDESIIDATSAGVGSGPKGYGEGAIAISADGVTVDGFTITGSLYNAIRVFGSSGNTITNNILSDNGYRGVLLKDSAGNNTITNNVISNSGRDGIYVGYEGDNTITGNVIEHSGRPGIYLTWSDDNIIENNTISYSGEVDSGEWVGGISLDGAFRNTLTGNTLSNQCRGISLFDNSEDNTLTHNTISNNKYGIYLRKKAGTGNVGNEAHYNNIVGNTEYGVYNDTTSAVDATNNWWGDASGPSGVGPGTGDAVSSNVDFADWLLTSIEAGGTGAVSMTAASEEPIIGISVLPTSIDFGAITSEAVVGGDQLIVSNLGNVSITVDAEIMADTLFNATDFFYTAALRLNNCPSDQALDGDLSTLGEWIHSDYLGDDPIEVGRYRPVNTGLECPQEILAGETYEGIVVFWAVQPIP